LRHFVEKLSRLYGKRVAVNAVRVYFNDFVDRLKKEHDFLLYFNPKLPTLILDPILISNLSLLVSTYHINRNCLSSHPDDDIYKL
jgi:hypothetical protein